MFKRLGKMNMVVESCGLMVQSHDCNPHDPSTGRGGGKWRSVCLCVRLYTAGYGIDFFFPGAVRTSYCKGSRASGSNRIMWWP